MDNQKIAAVFKEIGDILEIQGENRFRVLAYQKAALNIENLARELKDVYNEDADGLTKIPGIGKDLAAKIVELLTVGKCEYHQKLLKTFDKGLLDILRVRGVGPKKVKLFYASLKIDSIEKLRKAAQEGKLQELPGMGPKSETEILKSLEDYDKHQERMDLESALKQANELIEYMKKCDLVERIEYAGSLRRRKETIGDIDLLVACKSGAKTVSGSLGDDPKKVAEIMEHFIKFPGCEKVLARGETKSAILLESGVQTDLRVIDPKVFGAAMHYFTGSKAHNIVIRDRAKKMGLKINEYGVFKLVSKKGSDEIEEVLQCGQTEEEVFGAVGLPYIPPEMREDRGEIEAGLAGKLIKPIELTDLKGDMHVHSKWSDGVNEISDVARAYYELGYEYFALTDHSPAVAVAHGLTPERYELQWDEIDAINKEYEKAFASKKHSAALHGKRKEVMPFKILKGSECDIKPDGTMDLPDSVLAKLDIVVASVHSRFNMSEEEQTERVLKALKNPYVKILGHPSGRLVNKREPYAIDMEKIIDACIKHHVALEIDGQPERLDLFDYYAKLAHDKGAKFTIDSDSHNVTQIHYQEYGVAVARRGWVVKEDVLNALPLSKLMEYWNVKNKKI